MNDSPIQDVKKRLAILKKSTAAYMHIRDIANGHRLKVGEVLAAEKARLSPVQFGAFLADVELTEAEAAKYTEHFEKLRGE